MEIQGHVPLLGDPPLIYRFSVFFFALGDKPNPIDIMFQKVSGIGTTVETQAISEGGQNFYTQQVPTAISHDNLSLERGLLIGSPLAIEMNEAFKGFTFTPTNVLISLLSESAVPIASWLFMNAYPVKWSLSDMDAESNSVAIESMELAYQRMLPMKI